MKIFITGGSGFIGSRLLPVLADAGYGGYVLEHKKKVELPRGFSVVNGSLSDTDSYKDCLQRVDTVIHLAATVDDWSRREHYYEVMVNGTKRLFESVAESGVKLFIFLSSLAAVNDTTASVIDEQSPHRKKLFCHYANSKIEAERFLLNAADDKMAVVIVRAGWVIGADGSVFMRNFENRMQHIYLPARDLRLPLSDVEEVIRTIQGVIELGRMRQKIEVLHAVEFSPTWEEFVSEVSSVTGQAVKVRYVPGFILWPLCLVNYCVKRFTGLSINDKIITPTAYQLIVSRNRFDSSMTREMLGIAGYADLRSLIRRSFAD